MTNFDYVVTVTAETQEQADLVIAKRLSADEDLGFDYAVKCRIPQTNPFGRSNTLGIRKHALALATQHGHLTPQAIVERAIAYENYLMRSL